MTINRTNMNVNAVCAMFGLHADNVQQIDAVFYPSHATATAQLSYTYKKTPDAAEPVTPSVADQLDAMTRERNEWQALAVEAATRLHYCNCLHTPAPCVRCRINTKNNPTTEQDN